MVAKAPNEGLLLATGGHARLPHHYTVAGGMGDLSMGELRTIMPLWAARAAIQRISSAPSYRTVATVWRFGTNSLNGRRAALGCGLAARAGTLQTSAKISCLQYYGRPATPTGFESEGGCKPFLSIRGKLAYTALAYSLQRRGARHDRPLYRA